MGPRKTNVHRQSVGYSDPEWGRETQWFSPEYLSPQRVRRAPVFGPGVGKGKVATGNWLHTREVIK